VQHDAEHQQGKVVLLAGGAGEDGPRPVAVPPSPGEAGQPPVQQVAGEVLTGDADLPAFPAVPEVMQVRQQRSGEDESGAWLEVVAAGSTHPDTQGVPWHEEFPRDVIIEVERDMATAGLVVRYAALHEGILVGGGTMRIADGIAQLTGAGTAPAHRRRGVHTALLSARLADATAVGCDVAVITTQPGSKSQQNAQRRGFGRPGPATDA
jgi:ribosomal protein S18 acetylase RimI-like enzyme